MIIDIKLTEEQYTFLLKHLGSDDAIQKWIESCINHQLLQNDEVLHDISRREGQTQD